MAALVLSRICGLALAVVVAGLLVAPADAKHRRSHKPSWVEQLLTQRADQPSKPRSKHRLKSRGKRPVAPANPQPTAPQEAPAQPAQNAVPVPEARPADEQKPDAAMREDQKTQASRSGASDRLNEEKSRERKEARPKPSPPKPSTDTENEPEAPVVPIPTPKPDITEPEAQPPAVGPQPPEKPADADDKKMLPDPRSADLPEAKMPEEELACRERLKALGVEFEEHKAESNPEIGCSIPYPIVLKTLGKSVAIGPATELNCPMAEAATRFAADVIQPAAKAEFGADLKSINQASAFVCRPRHGTRKLSEHAFGNALDIASFTLSDGRKVEISPAPPEKDAKFLNAVRKAACGPFKTVLGPGADPDHSLHFHLDLEPRRHGGTFCQ
jgi:hypothetical protein